MLEARPTARAIVYLVGHFKIVKASAKVRRFDALRLSQSSALCI